MARVFVLALRPYLEALVGVVGVRADEVHATSRAAGELDDDGFFLAAVFRGRQLDVQMAVRKAVGQCDAAARGYAADLEFYRVEVERRQAVVKGCEGVGNPAGDALVVQIEADVQAYMLDINDAVSGVFRLVARQWEEAVPATHLLFAVAAAGQPCVQQIVLKAHVDPPTSSYP